MTALAIAVAVVVFPTSTAPSIATTPGASRIASSVRIHASTRPRGKPPRRLSGSARLRLQLLLDPLQAKDVLARSLLQHVPDVANLPADAWDHDLLERVDAPRRLLDLFTDLAERHLGAGHFEEDADDLL